MSSDCLFCKIVAGEIPVEFVYESDTVVAFRDISPQAPTHVLVIPRKHIATINDIAPEDEAVIGHMYTAAKEIAAAEGIAEDGYRTVMNCNEGAGQSVFHIHLHVLGGRPMTWPPG
ncbi:MAG: histidine triad nucleotide-binding protein [Woeseiaceae bacterium]|nr:histidine triad nucleotide-binding protein [Woeseiaceae bacterium]